MSGGWLELSEQDRLAAIAALQARLDDQAAEGVPGDRLTAREVYLHQSHILLLEQLGAVMEAIERGNLDRAEAETAMAGDFGHGYLFGLIMNYKVNCTDQPALDTEEALMLQLFVRLYGTAEGERMWRLPVATNPHDVSEIFDFGIRCAVQDVHPLNGGPMSGKISTFQVWRLRDGLGRVVANSKLWKWAGGEADWSLDEDHLQSDAITLDEEEERYFPYWLRLDPFGLWMQFKEVRDALAGTTDPVMAGRLRGVAVLLKSLQDVREQIADRLLQRSCARHALAGELGRGYLHGLFLEAIRASAVEQSDELRWTTFDCLCDVAYGRLGGSVIADQEWRRSAAGRSSDFNRGLDIAKRQIRDFDSWIPYGESPQAESGRPGDSATVGEATEGEEAHADDPALLNAILRGRPWARSQEWPADAFDHQGDWLSLELADMENRSHGFYQVFVRSFPSLPAAHSICHTAFLRQLIGVRQGIADGRIDGKKAQAHLDGDLGNGYILGLIRILEVLVWDDIVPQDRAAISDSLYLLACGEARAMDVKRRFGAVLEQGHPFVTDRVGKAAVLASQDVFAFAEGRHRIDDKLDPRLLNAMLQTGRPRLTDPRGGPVSRWRGKPPAGKLQTIHDWIARADTDPDMNPF